MSIMGRVSEIIVGNIHKKNMPWHRDHITIPQSGVNNLGMLNINFIMLPQHDDPRWFSWVNISKEKWRLDPDATPCEAIFFDKNGKPKIYKIFNASQISGPTQFKQDKSQSEEFIKATKFLMPSVDENDLFGKIIEMDLINEMADQYVSFAYDQENEDGFLMRKGILMCILHGAFGIPPKWSQEINPERMDTITHETIKKNPQEVFFACKDAKSSYEMIRDAIKEQKRIADKIHSTKNI